MIRAIIFDLGGVIVPLDFPKGYEALAELCPFPAAEIPQRISATGMVPLFETGKLDAAEFITGLKDALQIVSSDQEMRALWNCIFGTGTLIPETLLESLKQNHRLLLLSNTNSLHFPMIRENYPLLRHFDHYVLSYEVGALKPSPVIYEEAIRHAGCEPSECFFTDDIAPYVVAAKRAGIDAVQFLSYEQLRMELELRGVAC